MYDIIETGIAYRIQHARGSNGQWFRRTQRQTPWGYRWSKWTATDIGPDKSMRPNPYAGKARLPK